MKLEHKGFLYESISTHEMTELTNIISEKFGVDIYLAMYGEYLELSRLVVPKENRGTGVGSEVMKYLCDVADKTQTTIILSPADKGFLGSTTSKSRLVTFYKRFGFVENKGRSRDFSISRSMIRRPIK